MFARESFPSIDCMSAWYSHYLYQSIKPGEQYSVRVKIDHNIHIQNTDIRLCLFNDSDWIEWARVYLEAWKYQLGWVWIGAYSSHHSNKFILSCILIIANVASKVYAHMHTYASRINIPPSSNPTGCFNCCHTTSWSSCKHISTLPSFMIRRYSVAA